MSNKGNVFEYWKDSEEIMIMDWGEPSCWACRKPIYSYLDEEIIIKYQKEGNFKKIWSTTQGLQICHIIPRSLGGSDEPSNLVLLCHECHKISPDTTNRQLMLTWIKNKKSYSVENQDNIRKAIDFFNLSQKEIIKLGDLFINNKEDIMSYIDKNVSTHQASLAESSFIGAAISYMRSVE